MYTNIDMGVYDPDNQDPKKVPPDYRKPPYEVGLMLLLLVSVYKVPFQYWSVYLLGVLLGITLKP